MIIELYILTGGHRTVQLWSPIFSFPTAQTASRRISPCAFQILTPSERNVGDYPMDVPDDFIVEQNARLEEKGEEEYDYTDELWQTDVGKLVYHWIMAHYQDV